MNNKILNDEYSKGTRGPEAGFNLSWGSVIAGAVTFAAVFLVLSLITSALGFGFLNPNGAEPLSGVGVSTAISVVITLLLSFCAGGFVAGAASRRSGKLHGFLTWALSVLLLFTMVSTIISSVLTTTANVAGTVAKETANVAGSVASTTGSAVSKTTDAIYNEIAGQLGDANIDTDAAVEDAEQILRDTGVKELQPEYLKDTLSEASNEIAEAGKELVVNPENADAIVDDLVNSLTQKADDIGKEVDRDSVANAIEQNTDLNQEEAEETVDNIVNGLNTASEEAKVQINNAAKSIEETKTNVEETTSEVVDQAEDVAQDVTNAFSTGSVLIFVGLAIGLAATIYGGELGYKNSLTRYERYREELEKRD